MLQFIHMLKRICTIITVIVLSYYVSAPTGGAITTALPQTTLLNVPYASQAPLGEWSDPRQRDGCEEASIKMAMLWVWGQNAPADEIRRDIINMSEYEKVMYGAFEDTSAGDTANLMQTFYRYPKVFVTYNISLLDVKIQIAAGNLVLLPVNASKLYYNGPVRHTLVVTGFDDQTGEIIVHDSLKGANLRFKENILSQALGDYRTGVHLPLGERQTAMIVVSK